MSDEPPPPQKPISLSLVARPGITIRVLDGTLEEIGRGTERFEAQLPQGLYLVEWSSAGQNQQSMVRLNGDQEKVEVRFDPSDLSTVVAAGSKASDRVGLVDAVNSAIRPSERGYESSIILVVTGEPAVLEAARDLNLRLYDREEVAMRASGTHAPLLELGAGERAHCYGVRPGRYHIGFQSILGERLGQSVPALAGRQTLVFLTVVRTRLIVADAEEFQNEDSVGIDPARTVIVSVRGDEDDYRVRERVRLAGLMLFDLASGTNSLSVDVVGVLDDPKTDPLLRLYGALVALSDLDRVGTAERDVSWKAGRQSASDPSWTGRLRDWISDPAQPGLPTDATAACWKLQRLNPQSFDQVTYRKLPSRIEAPPMLESAWRWAIEESIARPDAVRGAAIVATARSAGGSLPWLCWELAAAKARFKPVNTAVDNVPQLMVQVAEKVASLFDANGLRRSLSSGLEALSPEIQATALRAMQLVLPEAKAVSANTVTDLALALGLPSRLLRKRLVNTSAALDAAGASTQSIELPSRQLDGSAPLAVGQKSTRQGGSLNSVEPAPGLSKRIRYKNDPQKGRFGGTESRGGFTAAAVFEKTGSKNWVRVVLSVEGPGRDGEEVQFHLHDSFRPPLKTRKLKSGTAKLSVTVWGGFTLGVWLPERGIELELDLTKLEGAPNIVRER